MQERFPCRCRTGGERAASGDAKASVVFEMVPMPVGIEYAKQEDKMKKFLVVLLSLGLIVAFAATASALDVKFGGQYYVTGQYEDNRSLGDTGNSVNLANNWTRTRVRTVFNVAQGLSFVTRFDALEKGWGVANPDGGSSYDRTNSRKVGTGSLQENIEFEQAYVAFKTAAGMFNIGYQAAGEWGTGFANISASYARIKWTMPVGPLALLFIWEKAKEDNDISDGDYDKYMPAVIYKFKGGDAGLLYIYAAKNDTRSTKGFKTAKHVLNPYMKAKFGPVYVEGEFVYQFGDLMKYDDGVTGTNVTAAGYGAYVLAKMNVGPAYFGASFAISTGDDPTTTDKNEEGPISTTQYSPGIIFGDANYRTWAQKGNIGNGGNIAAGYDNLNKVNFLAYNVFGGFNVTPKLNLDLQFWYLQADQTPSGFVSKDYGYEVDMTATYKIYDNLSYMVGMGYFVTGDYFKGKSSSNKVGNDYLVLNKLTLNF